GKGRRARFRPWLQAYDAVWLPGFTPYDRRMIRAQIQAVDDFGGATGWSLWNPASEYDPDWFNP
ncbi:MAG: putative glycoside hydrolase, partial [Anaerolineales bacterium]